MSKYFFPFFFLLLPTAFGAGQFDLSSVFDLTASEWNDFETIADPIHYPREPLLQIINRLTQRHIESLLKERAVSDPTKIDSLEQGSVVDFSRNVAVESVRQVDFTPLKNLPNFTHFYVLQLKIANETDAFCVSPRIPKGWNLDETDNFHRFDPPERSGFWGILLHCETLPVFVAPRLQWYPHTLLGDHGMDVSLLDAVAPISPEQLAVMPPGSEQLQALKFTDADQEPFYRLLTTAARIPREKIDREIPSEKCSVIDLFNRPQMQQGRLVRLVGHARRIERINVDDPEIVSRFGIDHYYQIALFTDDSQGNPLMICIKDIPPGLPTGEERDFVVPLSICGFFYKTWAYRKAGEEASKSSTQLAPLLIGAKIDWFEPPETLNPPHGSLGPFYVSSAAFLFLAFLWILFRRYRSRRQPVRFQIQSISLLTEPPEKSDPENEDEKREFIPVPEIIPDVKEKN